MCSAQLSKDWPTRLRHRQRYFAKHDIVDRTSIAAHTISLGFPESDAASVLLTAQDAWNTEEREAACRELARLEGTAKRRRHSLGIARGIDRGSRVGPCSVSAREATRCCRAAGRDTAAWRWRQWCQESRSRAVSFDDGFARAHLKDRERFARDRGADSRARDLGCTVRASPAFRQRQALMGFVQTIRKIGKELANVRQNSSAGG